jgi:hypothetical protein
MRRMCAGVGIVRGWRDPGKMRKQEKEKKWLASSSLRSRMFLRMALADREFGRWKGKGSLRSRKYSPVMNCAIQDARKHQTAVRATHPCLPTHSEDDFT